jgi:hypothetical protein
MHLLAVTGAPALEPPEPLPSRLRVPGEARGIVRSTKRFRTTEPLEPLKPEQTENLALHAKMVVRKRIWPKPPFATPSATLRTSAASRDFPDKVHRSAAIMTRNNSRSWMGICKRHYNARHLGLNQRQSLRPVLVVRAATEVAGGASGTTPEGGAARHAIRRPQQRSRWRCKPNPKHTASDEMSRIARHPCGWHAQRKEISQVENQSFGTLWRLCPQARAASCARTGRDPARGYPACKDTRLARPSGNGPAIAPDTCSPPTRSRRPD